ncbi:gastrin-releasing peptide precursor [Callorhinchus milii]|uniref:Gastrin-releasing peptide n=1 Tax=Callorhinchus milii TaxID=7868 RepID=K4FRU2_CALMI|nr:gastrin-releasing peptide precursor [Callorhinchus milii]AFK10693.1 Gastrin-releasing peptide [Callorhinchus milii]|eukprot:gi/632969813/ref/XP_007901292.1/ PREDICTED: gastrin-releasing peptide [Callorhinchus milii]
MGCEMILWKYRSLFSLIVLSVGSSELHHGLAAPVPDQGDRAVAKMFPRGSHWAVGHLMGKKSISDLPYDYSSSDNVVYPGLLEDAKRLEDNLHWNEMVKNILQLWEGSASRKVQSLRNDFPVFNKKPWQKALGGNYKEMADFLLQFMSLKDETPS